ncbi:ferrochelatase [Alkalicaulis satelles]|uniref:Ferrochelatase n=1 Tax=Alkalicaulis satelles TaxID=2609175 RepID=A0A5M6ZIG4_9PROT|nr:ferrochelatase [Alkalicaulis satelles]KAA5803825.1 ferrochelatase [Alkalicaulis satelles]
MGRRIAVVLFNLGGPDGQDSVKPFLRNLFNDPAIIYAPPPLRQMLAWLISNTRGPKVAKEYAKMGGGSPIVPETLKQAEALKARLEQALPGDEVKVVLAMRYWKPFVADAVKALRAFQPDETVLLPLYPQFSTTTTGSSLKAWRDAGGGPARIVCCYPQEADFIAAHAKLIEESWIKAGSPENPRVLFSAHGLPEVVVERGDSYQWQVEQTVAAVAARLPQALRDHMVCYQSRVGPLKWIGPSTEEAIERASEDKRHIILSPIAFVSEHIETLIELDEEYAELAHEYGAPGYTRVPALGDHPDFMAALAGLTMSALDGEPGLKPPPGGAALCPAQFGRCPCRQAGAVLTGEQEAA